MLTTSAITGFLYGPSGTALPNARIVFELQGFDTEAPSDVVAGGVRREFTLTALGAMPAGAVLWRNTVGLRGTTYKVTAFWTETETMGSLVIERRASAELGHVQVGSAASYTLQQLLDNPVPAAPSWNVNLSASVYDQLLADIANTRTSAQTAATASASALSSAVAAGAQIYDTAAAGIAAVATGAVFYVPLAGGGLDIRQKTGAGSSTSIGQFLPTVQSAVDETAGRVLTVGFQGLGAVNGRQITDANALTATGFAVVSSAVAADANVPGAVGAWSIMAKQFNAPSQFQLFARQGVTEPVVFYRSKGGNVWGDFREAFHQGNIVGTVAQVAGVPTGRIIERGANANGDFVRFSDGTQFCWRHQVASRSIGVAYFGGFRSGAENWTFPASFAAPPAVNVSSENQQGFGAIIVNDPTSALAQWAVTAVAAQADVSNRTVSLIAVGRWF